MNKLPITLVIANYMNRNWAIWAVQLSSGEVESLFVSYFES